MHTLSSLLPAYLWIGHHEQLMEHTTLWLQKLLCPQQACQHCTICFALRQQQYYAVTWLHPDKSYTLDQLTCITSTIAFALEPGQHHFFIIQRAEYLTPACSNSLLKSIEEPPAGYHFIFLAAQKQALLPTIQSRCAVEFFASTHQHDTHHDLYTFFTAHTRQHPLSLLKILDQTSLSEQESLEVLNRLLAYWSTLYKQALCSNNRALYERSTTLLNLVKRALSQPPMPGSSTLLWKNLYLQSTAET